MDSLSGFTENLFSYARMLGSKFGGGFLAGPSGSVAAASGLSYAGENYLLLSPKASPFEAEQLIAFFRARDLSFVAPSLPDTPQRLIAALEEAHIETVYTYTAMSFNLARARDNKRESSLLRVCGDKETDAWGRVVWQGFDGGEEAAEDYLSFARYLASSPRNGLYLLREGGEMVCCGMLHRTECTCGLYYFATPPRYRRRGYAGKLLKALTGEAARDYKEMVLLATPEGLPLYKAFGFKELAKIPLRSNSREL